jgi:rod shape-determining protein MreB
MFERFWSIISQDIGVDLGTANTMVHVKGKGIVIREPSVVARQVKTGEILAIGSEAKLMTGKTPGSIEVIRPLRAVQEAAMIAGARQAYLIEEPMAAAIGAGLPVAEATGQMVVDIGGGTSEIGVISLGGLVLNRSLRIAGDELTEAVINFARLKYNLLLGEATAEKVKIEIGSAYPVKGEDKGKPLTTIVRGRSLENGLPKSQKITSVELREALAPVVRQILTEIALVIEETPPELVADILERGIVLAGGGAKLRNLDKLISEETGMPVWVAEKPMEGVVRGTAKVLDDEKLLKQVKVVRGL